MDNNLFVNLKGLKIKVRIADFVVDPGHRTYEGELLDLNSEFIKMKVKNKIVNLRIKYIVSVEEL